MLGRFQTRSRISASFGALGETSDAENPAHHDAQRLRVRAALAVIGADRPLNPASGEAHVAVCYLPLMPAGHVAREGQDREAPAQKSVP